MATEAVPPAPVAQVLGDKSSDWLLVRPIGAPIAAKWWSPLKPEAVVDPFDDGEVEKLAHGSACEARPMCWADCVPLVWGAAPTISEFK